MILLGRLPFRWGAPPPAAPGLMSAGYRSLFGRWASGFGAPSTAPIPPPSRKKIGWFNEWNEPRLRHDPEDLERRLAQQRANTFGVKWYEEFIEAEQAALEAAHKAKSKKQRDAISEAVHLAANLVDSVTEPTADLKEIEEMLRHAANVRRTTASIRYAENLAVYIAAAMANDEEEAAQLLLLT